MELTYNTKDKSMVAKFEADGEPDLFKQLAKFQEVFEIPVCRNKEGDESTEYKFVLRKNEADDEFFEVVCTDVSKPRLLYAKIIYGLHKNKKEGMYPKYGKRWVKYDTKNKKTYDILTGNEIVEKKKEGEE